MPLLSRTECNARWLLHLINNNFLNFLTETILNPYLIEFSHPKNPKMWDPILVTLLKMRPHSSQSSRKNATPSSGTSPLASYKEVTPPPPPPGSWDAQNVCPVTIMSFEKRIQAPERPTKEYKYGTWGPRRRREKPGRVLVKRLRERLLVPLRTSGNWFFGQPSQNCSFSGVADDKHVLQMAGKYSRLHSVWSVTTPHLS